MKRFLAILVAMLMVLCANAFADAIVPEEIEVELDESYVEVRLGEDYAYTYLPADWIAVEAEFADETSELLGTFTNADGSAMLMVVYAESDTPSSYEEIYTKSVEAGLTANLAVINGYEFVNIATLTEDRITMICTFFNDEECTSAVVFTFSFPMADTEAMEPVCNQALGAFGFVEE